MLDGECSLPVNVCRRCEQLQACTWWWSDLHYDLQESQSVSVSIHKLHLKTRILWQSGFALLRSQRPC